MFSIVIPALNEPLLAMTTNSILSQTRYPNYEIIVVDDGSSDGSTDFYERYPNPRIRLIRDKGLGVARARNLGAANARGDYLVFIDGHCRISPDWLDRFAAALSQPDVAVAGPSFVRLDNPTPRGCGMFWPDYRLDPSWFEPVDSRGTYPVPLTTGACQAFRRDNFIKLGRYEHGFTRWGFEDVEICVRGWLLGYRVVVDPGIVVAHHFRESRGYDVNDVDVTYNFLRMLHMHFSQERIENVIQALGGNPFIAPALERIYTNDTLAVRRELEASRIYDDEWFFTCVNRLVN
jgi:glycosyltransferase involved in cell wall biosynthesis